MLLAIASELPHDFVISPNVEFRKADHRSIAQLLLVFDWSVILEPFLAHCKPYISVDQHGLMSGRSIATNLLCFTPYITENV